MVETLTTLDTGTSLTAFTVTIICVSPLVTVPSLTLYKSVVVPLKFAFGVYVKILSEILAIPSFPWSTRI